MKLLITWCLNCWLKLSPTVYTLRTHLHVDRLKKQACSKKVGTGALFLLSHNTYWFIKFVKLHTKTVHLFWSARLEFSANSLHGRWKNHPIKQLQTSWCQPLLGLHFLHSGSKECMSAINHHFLESYTCHLLECEKPKSYQLSAKKSRVGQAKLRTALLAVLPHLHSTSCAWTSCCEESPLGQNTFAGWLEPIILLIAMYRSFLH